MIYNIINYNLIYHNRNDYTTLLIINNWKIAIINRIIKSNNNDNISKNNEKDNEMSNE